MSTLEASDLDSASRSDLIARAEALGIEKADVLTRAELVDEIVKRMVADPLERRLARGLLGVARDLVARVVERGLHLPDAAALIRGLQQVTLTPVTPPIATVTLAEIYAGQGHRSRALAVLDEVLANEPDHSAARALREKVAAIPGDAIVNEIASEPPPPEAVASPIDLELVADADVAADEIDDDAEGVRDTLPPASDVSPTIAPDDVATTLRVAAPEDAFVDVLSRPTEIAPPFETANDRLVLVPFDATSALAHWDVGGQAFDEVRARAEGGALILRIVAVTPNWDGPTVEVRDIEVAQSIGDWWVCDLPSGAVLRGAVGWRSDQSFDPLAVALDVAEDAEHEEAERARRRAEQARSGEAPTSSSWRALAFAPGEAPYQASP